MDVLNLLSRYVFETDLIGERISQIKSVMRQDSMQNEPDEEFDDM